MTPDQLAPAVPTQGVIASLSVRPWVDHTSDGKGFAPMLITHTTPRRDDDTATVIESRMRSVAHALGAAPADRTLPDAGERIAVHNDVVLVRLDGTPHTLTTRAGHWGRMITEIGHVLLAVGLGPLSPAAVGPEVDEYLVTSTKSGRLYFAAASVAASARHIQIEARP
ncbi:hypothetical protein [Streptomyces sp. BH105]|uniref:hypothetical protein n=1 Tax=Streptomyces sp. BH105 TaxID=3410408 RepID=UPI003CF54066